MTVPPRLTADAEGRVHGANVQWNTPWPCPNGDPGGMNVPSGILGVLMHTMVGNLGPTIQVFNDPSFQASAHFGISQAGLIHQFGPINGWKAFHAVAANHLFYGIEHADAGNPNTPLTQAQINASAQLVELLSRVGNFPLQVTNSPSGEGYGTHFMGGAAFGGHTCPDLPPHHVRSAQRAGIIALAKQIRAGHPAPEPPPQARPWTSQGQLTLHDLAAQHLGRPVADVLRLTALNSPGHAFAVSLAKHVDAVFAGDQAQCPARVEWAYSGGTWTTEGMLSLSALAAADLHDPVHRVVQMTAVKNYPGNGAAYVNGVFARTQLKPAPGTVFFF